MKRFTYGTFSMQGGSAYERRNEFWVWCEGYPQAEYPMIVAIGSSPDAGTAIAKARECRAKYKGCRYEVYHGSRQPENRVDSHGDDLAWIEEIDFTRPAPGGHLGRYLAERLAGGEG